MGILLRGANTGEGWSNPQSTVLKKEKDENGRSPVHPSSAKSGVWRAQDKKKG